MLPLVIAVLIAEMSNGGLDVKALAMLGVLSGVGAALRPLGAGTAGVETVFFVSILAGRVDGPGFGFVLGCTTMVGVRVCDRRGRPLAPLPDARLRLDRARCRPVATGQGQGGDRGACRVRRVRRVRVGFLLNMWFWPYGFTASAAALADNPDPLLQYVPGDAVVDNLTRFFRYTVATTTLGWDTGRAITNVIA